MAPKAGQEGASGSSKKKAPGKARIPNLKPVARTDFMRKAVVKRMATRAGVQSMSKETYEFVAGLGAEALGRLMSASVVAADMKRCNTLDQSHVRYGARHLGIDFHGVERIKRRPSKKSSAKKASEAGANVAAATVAAAPAPAAKKTKKNKTSTA